MNEIKSRLLILFLPTILLSCNQGMYGDHTSDNYNIPAFGTSEAATKRAKLAKEYAEVCKNLNDNCTSLGDVIDCENMMDLIETPVCTKKIGEKLSANDSCSCNEVCNPDKIASAQVNNLSEGVDILKEEDISNSFAYSGLKAIASRVEFASVENRSSPKTAKIEALKIIESMDSGEYLGKVSSFSDPSSFVKFTMGNPVLKERFLQNLKSQTPPKIISSKFDSANVGVGDLISSGSSKYIIESQNNTKCIKKIGDSSCSGNIVGVIEKLENPLRSDLKYDAETKLKLTTACIQKTNCNGSQAPIATKKEKLSVDFKIEAGFAPSINEKLPAAIDCMKSIPRLPLFAAKVKEIYGDKADEILNKIKTTKNSMTLRPYYSRPSSLAKTNLEGLIEINNINTNRTKDGLSGTLFHEWMHNLGYKHRENPKPDVAYALGDLVSEMAQKGYCND